MVQTVSPELAAVHELSLLVKAMLEARNPEFHSIKISDTRPWTVNYYERKHVYLYSSSSLALSCEDLGTFSVPANTLVFFPFAQSTRVFSVAASTSYTFSLWATDELLPLGLSSAGSGTRSSTGTETNVASSASDVTILAANVSRLGATIYNDSTQILYLLLANAVSSATLYTIQLSAQGYYEVPFGYTGVIKGIWAAANGNARVTELT